MSKLQERFEVTVTNPDHGVNQFQSWRAALVPLVALGTKRLHQEIPVNRLPRHKLDYVLRGLYGTAR
jgi:hypothetical protein